MKSVPLTFALLTIFGSSSVGHLGPAFDEFRINHYSNIAWRSDETRPRGFFAQEEPNQKNTVASHLIEEFKETKVFWQQLEVAKQIVALHDTSLLQELTPWLNHEDRHLRGNAAFIFAGLGDERGFDVIVAILTDYSDRPEGQGMAMVSSNGRYHVKQQIMSDRYYAVHLLGELKDARAVPILVPFLGDQEINYKVAWALGEIGDRSAIPLLIGALDDRSSDVRVIAIESLAKLGAKEALPRLVELLNDNEKSHFDQLVSVAEAAQRAITELQVAP